jgi:hypothetical protein
MTPTNRSMRDLATRLLTNASGSDNDTPAAAQVLERLDAVLAHIAGQSGSCSLLERALALAQADAPTLNAFRIGPGPFRSSEWKIMQSGPLDAKSDQVILVTHVLELLRTFIGERLTLQLVKEAWPDLDPSSGADPLAPTP